MKVFYRIHEWVVGFFINLFTLCFYSSVYVKTHKEITISNCHENKYLYKKITWHELRKIIDKYKWDILYGHNTCFKGDTGKVVYGYENDDLKNYFWSSIVVFEGTGYILNTYSFIKLNRYMDKLFKEVESFSEIEEIFNKDKFTKKLKETLK